MADEMAKSGRSTDQTVLNLAPCYTSLWENVSRLKKCFAVLNIGNGDENVEEKIDKAYEQMLKIKNDIEEAVETLHRIVAYERNNQSTAAALEQHLAAMNETVRLIHNQLNGVKESSTVNESLHDTKQMKESSLLSQFPRIEPVTDAELKEIPGYLKGRLTSAQINNCIDKINTAVNMKYEIMRKPRQSLKANEKIKWDAFKKQNTASVKGLHFVTMDDLKGFAGFKVSTTNSSAFMILRHLRLMKEIREPQEPIRYALL